MGDLILFPQKEMGNIKRGTLMVNDFNNIDTYPDLIDYLKDNTVQQFSKKEAEKLADKILQIGDYFDVVAPTPIVNITKQFGFYVFKQPNMHENEVGNIYIGKRAQDLYGNKKVIIVGDKEEYFHQRFIIAHELGHYLMDYLGNPELRNNSKLFSKAYLKQNHDSNEELRADRFAAELLMPSHLFAAQYMLAMEESYDRKYVVSYLSNFFKTKKSSIEKRIVEVINKFTY